MDYFYRLSERYQKSGEWRIRLKNGFVCIEYHRNFELLKNLEKKNNKFCMDPQSLWNKV